MDTLALFPLHTVLFPGAPIQLYIFEERYKRMMNTCIESRLPFGVVLIQEQAMARPRTVGCTAEITQVVPLSGGRMQILAVGGERFEVTHFIHDRAYLMGHVARMPLIHDIPARAVDAAIYPLNRWVERYVALWDQLSEHPLGPVDLPRDPEHFVYLAAYFLQIEPAQKQPLLECSRFSLLADRLARLYRREVTLMETMLGKDMLAEDWLFSVN